MMNTVAVAMMKTESLSFFLRLGFSTTIHRATAREHRSNMTRTCRFCLPTTESNKRRLLFCCFSLSGGILDPKLLPSVVSLFFPPPLPEPGQFVCSPSALSTKVRIGIRYCWNFIYRAGRETRLARGKTSGHIQGADCYSATLPRMPTESHQGTVHRFRFDHYDYGVSTPSHHESIHQTPANMTSIEGLGTLQHERTWRMPCSFTLYTLSRESSFRFFSPLSFPLSCFRAISSYRSACLVSCPSYAGHAPLIFRLCSTVTEVRKEGFRAHGCHSISHGLLRE